MKALKLVLAPMDGVLDAPLRRVLTDINCYDYCESEFVRITDITVPSGVLLKKVPELQTGGATRSGTPVYVQLLGQYPDVMASSAALACRMGAAGIDLNFGCPAKQVNKSNGGAALLRNPDLISQICTAVRESVPSHIPVTAKMRLGYDNSDSCMEIAEKIFSTGVDALCVHGRTKADGYLPNTVRWDLIGKIRMQCPVPVIANGDIFDRASAEKCSSVTGCSTLMLARGALYLPNLANVIRSNEEPFSYEKMVDTVHRFVAAFDHFNPEGNIFARMKQFLSYLREYYNELYTMDIFKRVCRCRDVYEALSLLDSTVPEVVGSGAVLNEI
jgi:tRNA-dihydrouridine synthase C